MRRRLLSTAEAARLLRLQPITIRRAIYKGVLRAVNVAPEGSPRAVWAVPAIELERYRREHLGRVGRPPRGDSEEAARGGEVMHAWLHPQERQALLAGDGAGGA